MTVREITKMLQMDGWYLMKTKGTSHFHYKHPSKEGKVTIPQHKGDFPPKTAHSILKQAGLK